MPKFPKGVRYKKDPHEREIYWDLIHVVNRPGEVRAYFHQRNIDNDFEIYIRDDWSIDIYTKDNFVNQLNIRERKIDEVEAIKIINGISDYLIKEGYIRAPLGSGMFKSVESVHWNFKARRLIDSICELY